MTKFAALALLALLAICPLVSRAGYGALEGTVRDAKTNQPVSGAQVQLKMAKAGKVTVTTDAAGHYLFNSVPPGSGFSIKVEKNNYDEWKGNCPDINDGSRVKKDIAISPVVSGGSVGAASSGGGGASGDGVVSGVVSAGGQPLAGVTIKIGPREATSGANGAYSVKLPAGDYPVAAKMNGFKPFKGDVTVSPGAQVSRNIELKPKK